MITSISFIQSVMIADKQPVRSMHVTHNLEVSQTLAQQHIRDGLSDTEKSDLVQRLLKAGASYVEAETQIPGVVMKYADEKNSCFWSFYANNKEVMSVWTNDATSNRKACGLEGQDGSAPSWLSPEEVHGIIQEMTMTMDGRALIGMRANRAVPVCDF